MTLSVGAREADPVFEVTGVPAAEILRRCAAARAGHGSYPISIPKGSLVADNAERSTWRLLDFADLSDTEFVQAAHVVLLGRLAYRAEAIRWIANLRAGASRFEVLVRLVLSPEGRRVSQPRVSGIGLPAVVTAGHGIERAMSTQVLGPAVRRIEWTLRRVARARRDRTGATKRVVGATVVAATAATLVRRLGRNGSQRVTSKSGGCGKRGR